MQNMKNSSTHDSHETANTNRK